MKILSQAIIVFIVRLSFKFRLLSHVPPLSRCPPTAPKLSSHFLPPLLVRLQGHCSASQPLPLSRSPTHRPLSFGAIPSLLARSVQGAKVCAPLVACCLAPFLRQSQDIKQHRYSSTFRPLPLSRSPTHHPLNIIKTKNIRFFKRMKRIICIVVVWGALPFAGIAVAWLLGVYLYIYTMRGRFMVR